MVPLPAGYPGCDILLKVEAGLEPKICLPVKNPVSDKMVLPSELHVVVAQYLFLQRVAAIVLHY